MGFFSLCGIGNAEVPSADLVAKIVLTKIRYRREQTYCSFDIKPRSAVLIKPNPLPRFFSELNLCLIELIYAHILHDSTNVGGEQVRNLKSWVNCQL